jgi:hypothetical protein
MTCSSGSTRPNSISQEANASGDLSIATDRANHTVDLAITGAARTSIVALETTNRRKGDIAEVLLSLPATPGIALDFRNSSSVGTQLLPAEKFPGQLYTTDGETLSGVVRFVFTGTAWKYQRSSFPA